MAIDTAAKRFSMMGFGAKFPMSVLVPSGSVSVADRADLIWCYAGIALGEAVEVVVAAVGAGSSKRRKRKRRVLIDGVVYHVNNPEEERALLQAWLERLKAERDDSETPAERKQVVRVLKRVLKRVEKFESRVERQRRAILDDDEEVLSMYAAIT